MRPNPIFRALWRPVLWMGMERVPGAVWILIVMLFILMGLLFAGDYPATVLIVAGGVAGWVSLQKLAETDPQFFRVWFRQMPRNAVYPARRTRIATTGREWKRKAREEAAEPGGVTSLHIESGKD